MVTLFEMALLFIHRWIPVQFKFNQKNSIPFVCVFYFCFFASIKPKLTSLFTVVAWQFIHVEIFVFINSSTFVQINDFSWFSFLSPFNYVLRSRKYVCTRLRAHHSSFNFLLLLVFFSNFFSLLTRPDKQQAWLLIETKACTHSQTQEWEEKKNNMKMI